LKITKITPIIGGVCGVGQEFVMLRLGQGLGGKKAGVVTQSWSKPAGPKRSLGTMCLGGLV